MSQSRVFGAISAISALPGPSLYTLHFHTSALYPELDPLWKDPVLTVGTSSQPNHCPQYCIYSTCAHYCALHMCTVRFRRRLHPAETNCHFTFLNCRSTDSSQHWQSSRSEPRNLWFLTKITKVLKKNLRSPRFLKFFKIAMVWTFVGRRVRWSC